VTPDGSVSGVPVSRSRWTYGGVEDLRSQQDVRGGARRKWDPGRARCSGTGLRRIRRGETAMLAYATTPWPPLTVDAYMNVR
jgi:hypothetical protein